MTTGMLPDARSRQEEALALECMRLAVSHHSTATNPPSDAALTNTAEWIWQWITRTNWPAPEGIPSVDP
jgi:hypothetical protein